MVGTGGAAGLILSFQRRRPHWAAFVLSGSLVPFLIVVVYLSGVFQPILLSGGQLAGLMALSSLVVLVYGAWLKLRARPRKSTTDATH